MFYFRPKLGLLFLSGPSRKNIFEPLKKQSVDQIHEARIVAKDMWAGLSLIDSNEMKGWVNGYLIQKI